MDLNAIMTNIYGENASQSFDALGFKGGNIGIHRQNANIKYLDDANSESPTNTITNQEIESSYKASKIYDTLPDLTFSGGAKKRGGAITVDHVYPSAEYIDDADLKTFIKEFYLHYLVTNAHKNLILIVPTSATLKKLISDFKAALKKEGVEELSTEASKYAAKCDCEFKNYIFDVYGKSSNNNDGFPYQVDSSFPSKGLSDIYRRTNRASRQYFFKFNSKDKIEVANNDKMTGAGTLKLIGKCDRNVLVLCGDIPSPSEVKSKVVKASLAGGAKRNILRHEFLKCVKKYDDLDSGAYEFVARVAKASSPSNVAKYYSGDFVHSAFSIISASETDPTTETTQIETGPMKDDEIENVHESIVEQYHPVKNIVKMDKVAIVLPKLLRESCKQSNSGKSSNKLFISNLNHMYSAIHAPKYMLYADAATALTKHNDSYDGVKNALNIMSEMESIDEDKEGSMSGGYLTTSYGHDKSTPLIRSVYSALSTSPFIGSIAREFTPILMTNIKHSAFEDHNMNDKDDDDDNIMPEKTESNVCPTCGDPKCDGSCSKSKPSESDFDIRAFF